MHSLFHPGVIIGGAILLFGIAVLAKLLEFGAWLAGFYGATLWGGDPDAVARYVFQAGPGASALLHALPFLAFLGVAAKTRSKETIIGALIMTAPLYLASVLWTGILAEAWRESSFRATEIGRITGTELRKDVLACQDAFARGDLASGTTTGRPMEACQWMLSKEQLNAWCGQIFDAKRPFKDPGELQACTSRVKEMAKVEKWPKSFKWADFGKPWDD